MCCSCIVLVISAIHHFLINSPLLFGYCTLRYSFFPSEAIIFLQSPYPNKMT